MCLDLNASVLSTMPPYLVERAPVPGRTVAPEPEPGRLLGRLEEFAKQLFWDYQLGEAFVLATSRYSTGWPARFHVVPPWTVNVEMRNGRRAYSIGDDGRHRGHAPYPLPVAMSVTPTGTGRSRPAARARSPPTC